MPDFKPNDLIFLTKAYDDYFHQKNPTAVHIIMSNRLAKIEDIIDWESEQGKKIKEARVNSGKWDNLPLEDNKYILSIFFHDLVGRKGQKGVAQRGVPMFQEHPETHEPFFVKAPDWLYKEISKKCEAFTIEKKDVAPIKPLEERVAQYATETTDTADALVIKSMAKKRK